jgi:hypothetical protein
MKYLPIMFAIPILFLFLFCYEIDLFDVEIQNSIKMDSYDDSQSTSYDDSFVSMEIDDFQYLSSN